MFCSLREAKKTPNYNTSGSRNLSDPARKHAADADWSLRMEQHIEKRWQGGGLPREADAGVPSFLLLSLVPVEHLTLIFSLNYLYISVYS